MWQEVRNKAAIVKKYGIQFIKPTSKLHNELLNPA